MRNLLKIFFCIIFVLSLSIVTTDKISAQIVTGTPCTGATTGEPGYCYLDELPNLYNCEDRFPTDIIDGTCSNGYDCCIPPLTCTNNSGSRGYCNRPGLIAYNRPCAYTIEDAQWFQCGAVWPTDNCCVINPAVIPSPTASPTPNPASNQIICSGMFNCATNPPACQPGYRVPDECLADPNQCCVIPPYGSCDPSGFCTCTPFIDCVPDTQPTPTPAPDCPTNWMCIVTDQNSCNFFNGQWTPCSIAPGQNGTCCRPPNQGPNPCTNVPAYCRIPTEQTIQGSCEWNEIELPSYTPSCEIFNYPPGTLCCDAVLTSSCTLQLQGTCKAQCAANEFPDNSINDCMNPVQYPPSGWSCCILSSNPHPTPSSCIGSLTGIPGTCHFLNCPDGTTMDGVIPSVCSCTGIFNCTTTCCVLKTSIIKPPRPALNPFCPEGIDTAIGCIPVTTNIAFVSFLLRWAIGVGGGIAFLSMILSGFLILTSGGDKERLKTGKEMLGSSLGGLLLIIFGVYLLDIIGVRILRIPGL